MNNQNDMILNKGLNHFYMVLVLYNNYEIDISVLTLIE